MALNLPENDITPQGMGMGDDIGVEDVTPEEQPVINKDLAESTMARIYSTENIGTKNEQLAMSAERYINELFEIGNKMPELASIEEAQKVLFDMYSIESKQEVQYEENSVLSREEVDGINGNIRRQKKMADTVRREIEGPKLPTKDEIKDLQRMVGLTGKDVDGIMGPITRKAIESYNVQQNIEQQEVATRIDPVTGLEVEDITGTPEATATTVSTALGLPDKDVKTLVKIESGNVGYTAVNKSSGAYGKYQFIPSTAKVYAKRLGFKGDEWKKPENQDKMFVEFTKDNMEGLERKGLPTDIFHIYGAHQQGLTGFQKILRGDVNATLERNMRSNLPSNLKKLSGKELADAWINHWKRKTSTT